MDGSRLYLIAVGVLMLAWWLPRTVRARRQGMAGRGAGWSRYSGAARPVALMGAAGAGTLALWPPHGCWAR
jgi:hypothetical protein